MRTGDGARCESVARHKRAKANGGVRAREACFPCNAALKGRVLHRGRCGIAPDGTLGGQLDEGKDCKHQDAGPRHAQSPGEKSPCTVVTQFLGETPAKDGGDCKADKDEKVIDVERVHGQKSFGLRTRLAPLCDYLRQQALVATTSNVPYTTQAIVPLCR